MGFFFLGPLGFFLGMARAAPVPGEMVVPGEELGDFSGGGGGVVAPPLPSAEGWRGGGALFKPYAPAAAAAAAAAPCPPSRAGKCGVEAFVGC